MLEARSAHCSSLPEEKEREDNKEIEGGGERGGGGGEQESEREKDGSNQVARLTIVIPRSQQSCRRSLRRPEIARLKAHRCTKWLFLLIHPPAKSSIPTIQNSHHFAH
eukprot:TRINITY_DN7547_c0_g1_i1.p1 TRINITY_DN7547_c0_g1~~TRINITY_DN7547_c0_g1_i1.p1  ORF type:complete len:108 (-),score=18.27 TRINITY_DN7547_c0_g1_i1:138-461(-)